MRKQTRVLSWCTGSQEKITIVLSLFRSHWLAVVYCLVLCSGFCEPVHEDRTRTSERLPSLQKRRNFLRNSGGQRRKRDEREARVACEGRSANLAILSSHATRASSSPRFRLCSPEIRKKLRVFCRLQTSLLTHGDLFASKYQTNVREFNSWFSFFTCKKLEKSLL